MKGEFEMTRHGKTLAFEGLAAALAPKLDELLGDPPRVPSHKQCEKVPELGD